MLGRLREEFDPSLYTEAVIYAALGQTGRILGRLEETGGDIMLKVSAWWEPPRGEPRYRRLLEQMGLNAESVRDTVEKLDPQPPSLPNGRSSEVPKTAASL